MSDQDMKCVVCDKEVKPKNGLFVILNRYLLLTDKGNVGIYEPGHGRCPEHEGADCGCEGTGYQWPVEEDWDNLDGPTSGDIMCVGCVLPYLEADGVMTDFEIAQRKDDGETPS